MFSIIAACDQKNGIGKKNQIPWYLPGDFKHFVKITKATQDPKKQNAVVMGRKTWDSLPVEFKPLPGRVNVVLSSQQLSLPDQVLLYSSLDQALTELKKNDQIEQVFIIGGSQLYAQAIKHPDCAKIYLTRVDGDFQCDSFFPELLSSFTITKSSDKISENNICYQLLVYSIK